MYISLVNEYTDWEAVGPDPLGTRNATLDALGDAQYVAPLVQAAKNLRLGDRRQYFYVFDHTAAADSTHVSGSGRTNGSEEWEWGEGVLRERRMRE